MANSNRPAEPQPELDEVAGRDSAVAVEVEDGDDAAEAEAELDEVASGNGTADIAEETLVSGGVVAICLEFLINVVDDEQQLLDIGFVCVCNWHMKGMSANAVLRECEQSLRSLLSAAAADGDYTEVHKLAELARAVAALVVENEPDQNTPKSALTAEKSGKANSRNGKPVKGEYPKFFRRGDDLVKVGWSKKEKRTYHHRAPRRVLQATAAAVRQVGSRGRASGEWVDGVTTRSR